MTGSSNAGPGQDEQVQWAGPLLCESLASVLCCVTLSSGLLPSWILQDGNSISRSHVCSVQRQNRALLFLWLRGRNLYLEAPPPQTFFMSSWQRRRGSYHDCPWPGDHRLVAWPGASLHWDYMEKREKLNKIWVLLKSRKGGGNTCSECNRTLPRLELAKGYSSYLLCMWV